MKRSRYGKAKKPPGLMLTSLLDMFTIILIFLIVSFEAESKEFKLNPDLTLPESVARGDLKPAVNLAVTEGAIMMEDQRVFELVDGAIPGEHHDAGKLEPLVEVLKEEYEKRFGEEAFRGYALGSEEEEEALEPIVVLQADKELDYKTLHLILRSAATAGFFKYRLAVLKS